MSAFKSQYNLQKRKQMLKRKIEKYPQRLVIIAQKHPKSMLPSLQNPKILCQKGFKVNMIRRMLQKKIKGFNKVQNQNQFNSRKISFFIFINKLLPNGEDTIGQVYEKLKDEDGFLYLQYSQMETYGSYNLK